MSKPPEYKIRPAAIEDFETVFAIKKNGLGEYIKQTWGWDEDFQRKMQKEEFDSENISIIESEGKAIGTVGINEKENEIRISRLYLINDYQSKGIGSRIVNDIISKYKDSLIPIKLGVLIVNTRAKKLYEKLGFEVYGEENYHFQMVYKPKKFCKNCGALAEAKYCPQCGQKTAIQRYTIKHILHDFFHTFTHVDSGILYLIKELTIRPGIVAREYIEGKRKKYFSPMQYLILGVAIVTFFSINLNLGTSIIGQVDITGGDVENFRSQFIPFFYKYFNVLQFLTVPIMGFYSWFFYRKAGFNYSENLVFNALLIAQRHLLFLIFIPFLNLFPANSRDIIGLHFMLWTIYFIYACLQFYRPKKKIWAAIKALFILYLFLLTQTIILVGVFFLAAYKKSV